MSSNQAIGRGQSKQIESTQELLLDKDYAIKQILHARGFNSMIKIATTLLGSVWRAKYVDNAMNDNAMNDNVIIKVSSKKASIHSNENVKQEIDILKLIHSKYSKKKNTSSIIRYIMDFEDANYYYLIMEHGGIDLFSFIGECHKDITNGLIDVEHWHLTIKEIMKQILNVLDFLHSTLNLCHLDMSLENILIKNIDWIRYRDNNGNFKKRLNNKAMRINVCDFGACRISEDFQYNIKKNGYIGKCSYAAPNIYISNEFVDGRCCDIWSVGICIFICSFGCYPWTKPIKHNQLFTSIVINNQMIEALKYWKKQYLIDKDMNIINLLMKIFVIDEDKRIKIKDIKNHKWFCSL